MDNAIATRFSDVVIIGAGFSGVDMACQLQRQLGLTNYVIYDRAPTLGGAWAANRYPGCGVDIPAALYSLAWCPNPDFSSIFPPQAEILAYLERVAAQHNIPSHVKVRTEWKGARWIEKISKWHVYLEDLNTGLHFVHETKVLVSAVGGYTNPKYPDLPGLSSFQGQVVHTAKWERKYDLQGRNVVVIGNGCSASQVVPAIIEDVGSLTQFIRSPQYYLPMPNIKISPIVQKAFYFFPFLLLLIRWLVFWLLETSLSQFYNDERGTLARTHASTKSRNYIKKAAPERYCDLLTPKYDLGCRRRILDNKYLKSLHSPKLLLTGDSIAEVTADSIITSNGSRHSTDFIILATGFQFTQWQSENVFGRNGISMKQHWEKVGGVEAYKSVAMNDFPNLFYLLGPNAGSGHTSVLYSIECSIDLVIKVARPVLQGRAASIEVKPDAEKEWCDTIQGALSNTVLTGSCFSQFCDAKTGWNFFSYPFSSVRFWIGTTFPTMSHWKFQ